MNFYLKSALTLSNDTPPNRIQKTRKFIIELKEQLSKYGLFELVGLSKADQISESSIHIIVEFSLLKTSKIARNLIFFLSLIMLVTGICFLF